MRPFNRQTGCKMPNSCFGRVVWCLRLGHIDNGAGHGANHDHATLCFSVHQMTGNAGCEQIGAVNIDAPQFLHPVVGIGDCVEVLGKTGRSDKVVDFAMVLDNLLNSSIYGIGIGYIGIVGGNSGDPVRCERCIKPGVSDIGQRTLLGHLQGSRPNSGP